MGGLGLCVCVCLGGWLFFLGGGGMGLWGGGVYMSVSIHMSRAMRDAKESAHRVGPRVALGLGLRHAPHAAGEQEGLHLSE